YSYPYVVGDCAARISDGADPTDLGRGPVVIDAHNSRSLHKHPEHGLVLSGAGRGFNTNGRQDFGLECEGRGFSSGITLCQAESSGSPQCLGLKCTGFDGIEAPNSASTPSNIAPSTVLNCSPGSYMVGVRGRVGDAVEALAP